MKKILIITYYWPPAGGAPVYRWLNFASSLSKKGYNVIVLTTKNGDYPIIDKNIVIPKEIEVIRTFTPNFYNFTSKLLKKNEKIPYGSFEITKSDSLIKKFLLWFRVNFIAPDLRRFWNYFAYKRAVNILKTKKIDVIITTGAPNSTHLIGYQLKKNFNIKWIADFRDSWTNSAYLNLVKRNVLIKKYDAYLENKSLSISDAIVVCTKQLYKDFSKYRNVNLIYNNYNPEQFKGVAPHHFKDFSINHFGTVTQGSDLSALKILVKKLKNQELKFTFRFWGRIGKNIVDDIMSDKTINDYFEFNPPVPHSEMLKYLMGSSLLLLYMNNARINTMTLKIFEYIGSGIPILAIGPRNSEPNEVLEKSEAGKMFEFDEMDEIIDFILQIKAGKSKFTGANSYLYSLPYMTEKLINVIENI